ncbi:TVP38/TMEM64 family protein [Phocicoccus pinnipedialis]|uniref:TVP38/TMEM64 family membrane protein n=1 Tax=Phocicoccus pinnipedialis TaxID=110845 RepID=A0A6V7R7J1_9BACL|nr:TVP38/TMEM64 family protein [Jeotgalicoccus pinnipedialis]MBP1938894.1 putative membrane protein YdjX (TVP38/TMEM64 family) [Jeotgalicoccus pinnipedialis]CAD2073266.1 TVP38/TMEM64 family inner membrane protein YdjZ [Jeotgalicoccus pinnipedialis]
MQHILELLSTPEGIEQLFDKFSQFGILVGLFLVVVESFLPILPLIAIVILNTNSYGLVVGFLVSYAGSVTGSYSVFLIARYLFRERATKYINKHKRLYKMREFIDRRGFSFLFILLSLPFTPSSVVNIITAMSNIRRDVYLYILLASKFVMILSISVIGFDIAGFLKSPIRIILSIGFLVLLYILSKVYQRYIDKKMES